jgi:tetratricopeptide (TPR) repeat protein
MISSASFLAEYFRLLHPHADVNDVKSTLGYQLARMQAEVPWLQPIAYRRPPDLKLAETDVWLFKVAFDQTEIERLYHTAVALAAGGDVKQAEASLDDTLARIPIDARFSFADAVASAFYDFGLDAAAIRAFRRALALQPDPTVATTLAWILATTSDARSRDGRAALALVEPIATRGSNDPTVLSALAAALAETGRFPEAIANASRALDAARAAGDDAAVRLLQPRLESYHARRPWRQ